MEQVIVKALEECRSRIKANGGDMSRVALIEHEGMGKSISFTVDKRNSPEIKATLDGRGINFICDLTGSFMDFYCIKEEWVNIKEMEKEKNETF